MKTESDWLWGNLPGAKGGATSGISGREIDLNIDGEDSTMSVGDYLSAVSAAGAGRQAAEEKRANAQKKKDNTLLYLAVGGAAALLILSR